MIFLNMFYLTVGLAQRCSGEDPPVVATRDRIAALRREMKKAQWAELC
jgi:hypothetical protein